MRYSFIVFLVLSFLCGIQSPAQGIPDRPVEAKIITEYNPIAAGEPLKVAVKLTHENHYHTYGKVVGEESAGLPTQVTWNLPEGWRVEKLPWPATKELASTGGEQAVYKDDDLRKEFQKRGITLLKADWTDHDERTGKALKELNKAAIPVNALYIPGREKPIILPELLTVGKVKAALNELEKQ